MSKIAESLNRLFEKQRIILWYDEEQNFSQEFEELELDSVEKAIVGNNEFALKYKMLLEKPANKFLLYLPYNRPADEDNWLLDIELSNYLFHTDQEALVLQELELSIQYRSWIQQHIEFFKSKERVQKYSLLIDKSDNEEQLTHKLIQLVLNAQTTQLDDLLKAYTQAFISDKSENIDKELQRFGLFLPFWEQVESVYCYRTTKYSIYDFLLEVFQRNFKPFAGKVKVNSGTEVLLSGWKDAKSFEPTFKALAKKVESDLNVKSVLDKIPLEELIQEDVFEIIDQQIIKELSVQIRHENLSADRVEQMLKARESKFWYEKYQSFYHSLRYAVWLMEEVKQNKNIQIADYMDGFNKYTSKWYLIDQYYRLFLQHYRETNQNNVLHELFKKVHKVYSNTWLLELSDKWQGVIDKSEQWYFGSDSQMQFFKRDVKANYTDKGTKIFVVISDAFRYECGKSLHDMFAEESRFTSRLSYQVTGLPSYTQLGMASLLPHSQLAFGELDDILADGKSTKGLQARKKVLEENSTVRATTILAEDLMKMASKSEEAKSLVQNHDLIYVYHNRIDKLGDDKTTEDKVIEASKEEINFLKEVARKVSNINGNHLIFTADHGFVYQHEELEESDFADAQINGEIIKESRRYVLGSKLTHNHNVVRFSANDLMIQSDVDILIPKGISRLRKHGSGSRYVHGGSTLQETVVPVLFVACKRADTVSKVDIDILNKASNRITTNIHTVKYYQQQPVGNGMIARTVKSYFAVIDKNEVDRKVISDMFTYTFDSDSKKAEEREVPYKFTISTNLKRSQNVYLIIEEKVERANKWNTIAKFPYSLSLAMENDFDDF